MKELTSQLCRDCALKIQSLDKFSTCCGVWKGKCAICHEIKSVAHPRDYGWPTIFWKDDQESD